MVDVGWTLPSSRGALALACVRICVHAHTVAYVPAGALSCADPLSDTRTACCLFLIGSSIGLKNRCRRQTLQASSRGQASSTACKCVGTADNYAGSTRKHVGTMGLPRWRRCSKVPREPYIRRMCLTTANSRSGWFIQMLTGRKLMPMRRHVRSAPGCCGRKG